MRRLTGYFTRQDAANPTASPEFSFDTLRKKAKPYPIEINKNYEFYVNNAFMHCRHIDKKVRAPSGFKIHVNLTYEHNPQVIAKAWDVILPIFFRNSHLLFHIKVTLLDVLKKRYEESLIILSNPEYHLYDFEFNPTNGLLIQYQVSPEVQKKRQEHYLLDHKLTYERFAQGIHLTLYIRESRDRTYEGCDVLCNEINAALNSAGISPAITVPTSDFQIAECPHLSIRRDLDEKGSYVEHTNMNKYDDKDHPIIKKLVSEGQRTPVEVKAILTESKVSLTDPARKKINEFNVLNLFNRDTLDFWKKYMVFLPDIAEVIPVIESEITTEDGFIKIFNLAKRIADRKFISSHEADSETIEEYKKIINFFDVIAKNENGKAIFTALRKISSLMEQHKLKAVATSPVIKKTI